jgi:hypothetical protein
MSGQYKDGKPFEPKPKTQKRKSADELFVEHNTALLLQKLNLLQQNIADDFLDDQARSQKIVERAIHLATLHPFEMLIKLASTELHLETTLFLYEETFKQKQFLEAAYLKSGKKSLDNAVKKSTGKAKVSQKYIQVKEFARQIIADMKQRDFKVFCRKMRAKLTATEVSDSAIRNYFKEITGLKSTK